MALGKCRECGRECAKSAKTCPGCGVKSPVKHTTVGAWIGLGVLAIIFVKVCSSSTSDKPSAFAATPAIAAAAAAEQPLNVAIGSLLSEYKDNEVRADQRFKGHTISTTGKVSEVKKDLMNSIYVIVGTGEIFEIPTIQCFPSDGQEGKAAALSKGDTVTIQGRVDGLMMNVMVKDCQILK